jgi:hypothetical protein
MYVQADANQQLEKLQAMKRAVLEALIFTHAAP